MTRIQAAEYTERRMTMEENRIPDVSEKSPWERAMGRVLMGIILTSFTFSFWCLDHILPAIGTVLMVLGFRALRKENPWFRSGYLLAAVRAGCVWVTLILNTTILPGLSSLGDGVWGLVSLALAAESFSVSGADSGLSGSGPDFLPGQKARQDRWRGMAVCTCWQRSITRGF